MEQKELLIDAFGRIRDIVHRVVDGASAEVLQYRADPEANTIAWLVWHLTRGQDAQLADVAGLSQQWHGGWAERFALPFGPDATGYGQSSAEVGAVTAPAELLGGYHDAVHAASVEYLETLDGASLDRVVDTNWTPAVTLGVRIVSVIGDDWQHAGQASFVKGLAQRALAVAG